MINSSISIKNISKSYKVYANQNDRLKEWLIPFSRKRHEEKWVLRGIDLEIAQGEAVGIIGMNGAGKSTLLKIITGTVVPTTGSVNFYGSVAALLELGLGFHPDFTGRQNVYNSGQLLGYTVDEISAHMQQIEEFAEIGQAIDAPVRTYSSGMQVRLAFSVATMKRPDILIVDEALSVGDSYFQHKSFGRIREFQKEGTTLLFVSHDKEAIQAICNRAVLLDKGVIIKSGEPEEIMDFYNAMIGGDEEKEIEEKISVDGRKGSVSGGREVTTTKLAILNSNGIEAECFSVGEKCNIVIEGQVHKNIDALVCGIAIKNRLGQDCYGINTYAFKKVLQNLKAGEKVKYNFSIPMNFGAGNYSLTTCFSGDRVHVNSNYEWIDLAKVFEVINTTDKEFIGTVYLPVEVDIEKG